MTLYSCIRCCVFPPGYWSHGSDDTEIFLTPVVALITSFMNEFDSCELFKSVVILHECHLLWNTHFFMILEGKVSISLWSSEKLISRFFSSLWKHFHSVFSIRNRMTPHIRSMPKIDRVTWASSFRLQISLMLFRKTCSTLNVFSKAGARSWIICEGEGQEETLFLTQPTDSCFVTWTLYPF